jgi:uncharacterized hydantoinase/oxoprolinase family protein
MRFHTHRNSIKSISSRLRTRYMFVAIGMTTMDLEPVKRSTRNEEKKRREEKHFL